MYVYVHVQYVYTAIYMYVQVVQVSYIHRSSYIISEISHFFLPLSGYMIWDVLCESRNQGEEYALQGYWSYR